MKIYPFDAIYPNVDLIASTDSFFGTVRDDYAEYYKNGFFHHSDQRAFYIMEIRTGTKVHSGIVVCLNIEDYTKGKIVRHEQTISSSEQSMLKILLQRGAMVKPVLLCHPVIKDITKEIEKQKKKRKPFLQFTIATGPQQYSLYQIPEKEGAEFAKLYQTLVPKLYIADGHHRCSIAEKLNKLQGNKKDHDYSLILSALFPFDQLDILDYNKVVQLPYHLRLTRFVAEISKYCDIQLLVRPQKPERKHDLTMCIYDEWYLLRWKPEILKKYKKSAAVLDADILDIEILDGVLGIIDVRTDNRVQHISGDLGPGKVEEKVRTSEHHAGFCIYPVQFDELVKVSDSNGTLPPKSTWFEPRMINGIVVKSY
jgi:uncharacterized protein (DUF1015 family)